MVKEYNKINCEIIAPDPNVNLVA